MTVLSTAFAAGSGNVSIGDPGVGLGRIADIGYLISAAIGTVFIVSGILVFTMLVWGGIQWISSGGDKDATQKAKDRITHALVGLSIVAGAWAVTKLVEFFFGISIIGGVTLPTATTAPTF